MLLQLFCRKDIKLYSKAYNIVKTNDFICDEI